MRLVTRGDLDGLTCAVLITSCEAIGEVVLIHPQDITDHRFTVTQDDILANLPFSPACGKWFDHHLLTDNNDFPRDSFEGRYALAPSAARVVYDYYVGSHPGLKKYERLIGETDRLDAALLTMEDVLDPKEYILLGLTLDPRTGLGSWRDYFLKLVEALKTYPIEAVLTLPAVMERTAKLREQDASFRELTRAHSHMDGNVVFTDFRDVRPLPVGNRFLVYTLFPEANVSLRVHWGPNRQGVVAAVGHSIFNRSSRTTVGILMSKYGGGGHKGAGTCLLPADEADAKIAEIIEQLKKDG